MALPIQTSVPIFSDEFRHALDGKNRITIPSRWRQNGTDEFFLLPNPLKACLTVMPPHVFNGLGEDAKAKVEPAKRQDFIRQLYAKAQNATVDKQGRLLISEEHCRSVGLRGEVVLAGAQDRFEIWVPEKWDEFLAVQNASYLEVAQQIGL